MPKDGYIDVDGMDVNIGKTTEWAAFVRRNPEYMKRQDAVATALNQVFARRLKNSTEADRLVFGLGYLVADEFTEVLLLAANGFGSGALRTTRLMFEQLVTAKYISVNAGEAAAFLNYFWIQRRKLATAVAETCAPGLIGAAELAEINEHYEKFKKDYIVTACEDCKSTRLNHTWHKLDVVAMARKVGLGNLIVEGYLLPLRETHATVPALLNRVEETEDLVEIGKSRPDIADLALCGAHGILLCMFELQKNHFELAEFEATFEGLVADYNAIWGKDGAKNLGSAALETKDLA